MVSQSHKTLQRQVCFLGVGPTYKMYKSYKKKTYSNKINISE